MADVAPAPPHGRYRRAIDGAGFSLEANTENVPTDGRFYLMRGGEVALATEDFQEAITEYNRLCKEFWLARMDDENPPIRVAAAWGLLGLDPSDKVAIAIIQTDGTPQERKRLEQAQSRRRALRGRAAAAAKTSSNAAAAAAATAAANAAAALAASAAAGGGDTDDADEAEGAEPAEAEAEAAVAA